MNANQPVELPSHEVLSRLARDDPQAYEALRKQLIDSFIDSAPEKVQSRLRGTQFRVDCVRRLSHSALGSTVRIYELMWKSFLRLNNTWQTMGSDEAALADPAAAMRNKAGLRPAGARILEFRPRPPQAQGCG